jgi:hypothetical protein
MENPNAIPGGTLHNLSGGFTATFTSDVNSGAARYPYQSQQLQNSLAAEPGYLEFHSTAGSAAISPSITNDRRSIGLILRSDIAPGTYDFPPEGAIKRVTYSEVQKVGAGFYTATHNAISARLELNITDEGRRYSGKLDFEVLINGETLTVASSFNVVVHFTDNASGPLDTLATPLPGDKASEADLQNITGSFNAIFPVSLNPDETSYARAPYHSSELSYNPYFAIPDINFYSQSGTHSPDSNRTSDARGFEIHLKKDIETGTHKYPDPLGPITQLIYTEIRRTSSGYISYNFETLDATLELEVFDKHRYVAKNLTMRVRPPEGKILYIKADFDIYLSRD